MSSDNISDGTTTGEAGVRGPEPPSTGKSALRTYVALMTGRILGFVRDAVIAGFGYSAETDILQLGLRVSNSIQSILGDQALSASLVPAYSRRLSDDGFTPESARRLAGATFARLLIAAGVLGCLGSLFAPQIADLLIRDQREAEIDIGLVTLTLRFLMPMAGFLVLAGWCMAILNSHRRFFLPYLAPAFWNLAILTALAVLFQRATDPSIEGLVLYFSVGALVGGVLQLGVQLPAAVRINGGLPLSLRSGIDGLTEFGKNLTPVFFGRGSLHLLSIVEAFVAVNFLAQGSLTALGFSQRIFFLALLLCGMVQAFVYLPEFSRLKSTEALRAKASEALSGVWFLTIPAAFGLFLFSYPVVGSIFRWNNYGDSENLLGALILSVYAIGLVPTGSSRVLQSALYSQNRAALAAWTSVVRSVLSLGFAVATMHWWNRWAVSELTDWLPLELNTSPLTLGALAFCTASAVASYGEWWYLRRRSGLVVPVDLWRRGLRFIACATVAGVVAAGVWWAALVALDGVAEAIRYRILGAAVVGAFAAAYLGLAGALRLPEFERLVLSALRRQR